MRWNAAVSARAAWIAACLLFGTTGFGGCSKESPPPPPRVVDVTAVTIEPRDAPVVHEFVGQTQGSREVEIRARVDGFLEKRVYTDGALVRYACLAKLSFDNGYTSYFEVLDAERSLFQARLQLTQTQGLLYLALVNLYKALGGGWVDRAEELAPRPGIADRK